MANDVDRNDIGDAGASIRAHDWATTPLGRRDEWPPSLRSAVDMILAASLPMSVAWGPSLILICNAAYAARLGDTTQGTSIRRSSTWPALGAAIEGALNGRAGSAGSVAVSPLRDDMGMVAGTLQIVIESDAARHHAFHQHLEEALRDLDDPGAIQSVAARLLGTHLGAQRVGYAEDLGDGEHMRVMQSYAEGVPAIKGDVRYADLGPELLPKLRAAQRIVRPDIAASHDLPLKARATLAQLRIGAALMVPLVKNGQLVASMAVHYRAPHAFDAAEIALVADVAERTWAAVERARATNALRDSEVRYRALFDSVDAGLAVVDLVYDAAGNAIDYRFVEVNHAFEAQTGLTDAPGRTATELVPGLEKFWIDTYAEVALTGRAVRLENGSEPMGRWFDVHAFRVGDPAQCRVAILFNDISARRRAELQLRDLNERLEQEVLDRTAELRRFRDVVDATTSPICAFDAQYRVLAFNKAHQQESWRIFGRPTQVGEDFSALFPDDQVAAIRALMDRALAGETYTVVEEFGDPDRAKPYWKVTYTPLRDEDGTVVGAFHLAMDITAQLRAEAELSAAQEALRQSQKMEAMGSLTGGVAHDFNNLLTPIFGSLDLLQRRGLGGEREQRLIAGALQSAERAKTLVQRLLAFARRQPLQSTAVDIGALVEGMADLVASTSGPQTRVVVDTAPDLPAAIADPNQLEMAILNLSVNARDAMPDGGRLTMTAREELVDDGHPGGVPPGRYVCLSVADTGTGMDADTLKRAIEPFFSTKGIGKGTGLGLSMVHGLAAQLGGALTIDSMPGLGTDIRLWLPATDAEGAQATRASGDDTRPSSGRALVVDDEGVVRAATADMIADLGYGVVEAASAEEALRLVAGGLRPTLLVTDHLMPGMNGTDLARTLRQRDPALRVLIVSGFAEVESVAPDLPRLVKPFRQADIAAALSDPRG